MQDPSYVARAGDSSTNLTAGPAREKTRAAPEPSRVVGRHMQDRHGRDGYGGNLNQPLRRTRWAQQS
jgi:hypothetical protein